MYVLNIITNFILSMCYNPWVTIVSRTQFGVREREALMKLHELNPDQIEVRLRRIEDALRQKANLEDVETTLEGLRDEVDDLRGELADVESSIDDLESGDL
jgi:chromosome segregation ATPase